MHKIMKATLVLFLFFSMNWLSAQSEPYNYTVQIGTFASAKVEDFKAVRGYGFVYADQLAEDLHQIYIGGFKKETEAEQLLKKVKSKGYLDAYVTQRRVEKGQNVNLVQLATKSVSEKINWNQYLSIGNLYVQLMGNNIKILTGIFSDNASAKSSLSSIQQKGFKDAFVKELNSKMLHRISAFETSGVQVPAPAITQGREIVLESVKVKPSPATEKKTTAPPPKETLITKGEIKNPPPPAPVPTEFDKAVLTAKTAKVLQPNIRAKVKRTSALSLQKVMKIEKAYQSSLDGLYGKGTKKAYDKIMTQNRQLKKYAVLAKHFPIQPIITDNPNANVKGFMEWEVLQILQSISADINAESKWNKDQLKEAAYERARLFLLPKSLTVEQATNIENWNNQKWMELEGWAAKDPLNLERVTALKVTYFQSQVLIEDFFMDKGLKYKEAKPLALSVLKTVVDPYLERSF